MKNIHSLLTFSGATFSLLAMQAQERPNILIIQCDQMAQWVVGAYGQTKSITPVIDSIASQGVRFSRAYIGCPLSQPSRCALWSGMMPHQTNVRSNSAEPLNKRISDKIPTLGSLFSENGYLAVHFGKCHDMGSLRGFIHKEPVGKPFTDSQFPVNSDSFKDVGTCQDAVNFLNNPPRQPFICIADFQNPHNICGFVGCYPGVHSNPPFDGELPPLPSNFEVRNWQSLPIPIQYICCTHRRLTQASHWSPDNYRYYLAAYQHYTKMVCKQIEQVINALKSTSAAKNTIIIIMADHGDGIAAHRMVTKQVSFYDEVTNVPFIISGPGVIARRNAIEELVQPTTDLLPTLCELAGISVPKGKLGISLCPLLKGNKLPVSHRYVTSEWHTEYDYAISPGRMIRTNRYKYTSYLEGKGEELYDMKKDPKEQTNLAKNPKYKKIVKEHRALLNDYVQKTKDDFFTLKVQVDKEFRTHKLGYPHHEGTSLFEKYRQFGKDGRNGSK